MSEKTVFQKIIDRELPAYILYEDDFFIVFLDAFPASKGHSLVVPKKVYRWVWDVEPYAEYMRLARALARAQQKAFQTDMIFMDVRGDEVPHAHIHVRPVLPKDGTEIDFESIADTLRDALEKEIAKEFSL